MKTGGEKEYPAEGAQAPSMVQCDVCGKQFNRRYLKSHKRLSHSKKDDSTSKSLNESKTVETILKLYLQLSSESQKNLLERLAAMLEAPRD